MHITTSDSDDISAAFIHPSMPFHPTSNVVVRAKSRSNCKRSDVVHARRRSRSFPSETDQRAWEPATPATRLREKSPVPVGKIHTFDPPPGLVASLSGAESGLQGARTRPTLQGPPLTPRAQACTTRPSARDVLRMDGVVEERSIVLRSTGERRLREEDTCTTVMLHEAPFTGCWSVYLLLTGIYLKPDDLVGQRRRNSLQA
jgi:hypothetical protein